MPNLTHLALNLHRNGTWPLETLSAISALPSVRTADLWLDIASECRRQKPDSDWRPPSEDEECIREDQYLLPFVNETSAPEVFEYMRNNKVGDELQNVTFWAGDWSRAWDGPIYIPPWIENRKTKVVCSAGGVDGRGDEVECVVEVGARYWEGRTYDYWD